VQNQVAPMLIGMISFGIIFQMPMTNFSWTEDQDQTFLDGFNQ